MRSQCAPKLFSCQKSPITARVAANIAVHRKRAGMTQRQVADCLSLEKETISRIESGKITVNLERLEQFSRLFRCPLHELLRGEDREKNTRAAGIAEMLMPLSDEECDAVMRFVAESVRLLSHKAFAPKRHIEEPQT